MTFPAIQATNTSVETGASTTSHTVNLPASIASGDLLIVIFGMAAPDGQAITWPGGWTEFCRVDEVSGADAGMASAWRTADGTEGSTITVGTTSGTRSAHVSMRITGHENPSTQPPQAATSNGVNGDSDPPNLPPTGGAKDYLWMAVSARTHDGTGVISAPTNYTNIIEAASGTGSAHVLTSFARRNLNASSDDPAAFTGGDATAEWTAATIAVHPAGAASASLIFDAPRRAFASLIVR